MKKKISRILGVFLTAVLLTSLLAMPVSADVTQPSVSLADFDADNPAGEITAKNIYSVTFQVLEEVDIGSALDPGTITVEFPSETTLGTFVLNDITILAWGGVPVPPAISEASIPVLDIHVTDTEVTLDLDTLANNIAEYSFVRVKFYDNVRNPDDPGDYTLTVATSEETTAVESAPYTIEAPSVAARPGIVDVYNPSNILVDQKYGDTAIHDALARVNDDGFRIVIGPGTYNGEGLDEFDTPAFEDLTIRGGGAADDIIWKGDAIIDAVEVTIDGITFQGAMTVSGDKAVITDCIFKKSDDVDETLLTFAPGADDTGEVSNCTFDTTNEDADDDVALFVDDEGLDVSGCSFIVDEDDVAVSVGDDVDIDDCEFTGSSGVGVNATAGSSTVDGCTFDGLANAFDIDAGSTICIAGNTITNCTGDAIVIDGADEAVITGNTISDTDEDEYALVVNDDSEVTYVLFNNIIDNEGNVDNSNDTEELNATNNWWGDADGPASDSIATDSDVDTDPALGAPVTGGKAAVGAASLDAKTAAGVKISSDATATNEPEVMGGASYESNPATATPEPAVGFFDAYVSDPGDADVITIRFYGDVSEQSQVLVWSDLEGAWVACSDQGASTFGGYAWCKVEDEDTVPILEELPGIPFAIVTPPAEPELQAAVEIIAPAPGDTGVVLKPVFAWTDVGTPYYEFQLSDNPYFAMPFISDSPKLAAAYFAYPAELEYGKSYYWRVRSSISSATAVCVGTQCGPWAMGIFTIMEEPVEPPEIVFPEYPEPQPPVVIPPAVEITPTWIYVIIGIGGVLVIGLIVLIVTTRRTAP